MSCSAWQSYERRTDEIYAEHRRHASHLRQYRYFSVLSELVLAIFSLGLCAYGIERQAKLLSVAAILGPVAGLVFSIPAFDGNQRTIDIQFEAVGFSILETVLDGRVTLATALSLLAEGKGHLSKSGLNLTLQYRSNTVRDCSHWHRSLQMRSTVH
jgi:hypothetical protein